MTLIAFIVRQAPRSYERAAANTYARVGLFGDRPPLRSTLTGGRPPGRKLPDPCWGGLAIIGGNEAKCRPGDNLIVGLLKAAPKHEGARG